MPSVVSVIGGQWGDEGKGKIVDVISEKARYCVRFQGGSNAGHTIIFGGNTYKLRLLPSGTLRESNRSAWRRYGDQLKRAERGA